MKAARLAFLAAVLAALSAGCGGGDGKGAATTATAPAPTPAPVATGTPGPTPQPAFQSFAYDVQFVAAIESPASGPVMSIERRVQGVFEAPSSHAFAGGLGVPGQTPGHQAVVIGDQAWYREDDGAWQQMTAAAFLELGASALTSAHPGFLNDTAYEGKLQGLDFTTEESAGVTARKYVVSASETGRIGDLLRYAFLQDISQLQNVDLTVWTSEATGALVRLELSTTTTPAAVLGQVPDNVPADAQARVTLHVELSQINDPSIKVSPPI